MVKTLHSAGIEVILDVVYNHTGEGNHLGPTLSLRASTTRAYYRLEPDNPRFYTDFTGTGNCLNMQHPRTIQLIMDSLRYWVTEMHVDGFRFDLAPVLARELYDVDKLSAFFDIIHQDPTLARREADRRAVGRRARAAIRSATFPIRWAEWNGKYRDAVRHFWRGDAGMVAGAGVAARRLERHLLSASGRGGVREHQLRHRARRLHAARPRELRAEAQRGERREQPDGHNDNISRNWGVEGRDGRSERSSTCAIRVMRDFLATLAFSQGVPMLAHGDEIGRTQRGNNNAYAQDNEITWMDWELDDRAARAARVHAQAASRIRQAHPVLRRRHFFRGEATSRVGAQGRHLAAPRRHRDDGRRLAATPSAHALGMLIDGEATDEIDERGRADHGRHAAAPRERRRASTCAFTLPTHGRRRRSGW